MDLILWRHAEAEDGSPDLARELTAKGHKQAAEMARWLSRHLPKEARTLVSPAIRARQTAEALTRDYTTVKEISPGAPYTAVLVGRRLARAQRRGAGRRASAHAGSGGGVPRYR